MFFLVFCAYFFFIFTHHYVILIWGEDMRLRNVKGAASIIEKSCYIVKNPKEYKGCFSKLFLNDNPIHLEIGSGKGDFIINMAKKYPDINFIGLEMFDSIMVRIVQKLEDEDIPNLRLIKMDGTYINDVFAKDIDTLYLNFSDPWPKARHEHRRLTSSRFLERYDSIFKDKKTIIQKTDNRKLFEYSLKSFTDYGYKIEQLSLDLHKDDYDNVLTEYETKFSALGYPIYMAKVVK